MRHAGPRAAIGVDAVVGVHQQIVGAIPPDEMARTLALMLPAMNLDDRTEMLGGMRAEAPAEVFEGVWGLAHSVLAGRSRRPGGPAGAVVTDLREATDDGLRSGARPGTARYVDAVKRTAVNPWPWSVEFGFNQGEVVEGAERVLYCAGQTSVDANGVPQHAGDMGAQVSLALDNVEAVLGEAGMGLADVVRLNIYTTDVDALLPAYAAAAERLAAAGVAPPGTLLGVARLAFPELMVELEATAVA